MCHRVPARSLESRGRLTSGSVLATAESSGCAARANQGELRDKTARETDPTVQSAGVSLPRRPKSIGALLPRGSRPPSGLWQADAWDQSARGISHRPAPRSRGAPAESPRNALVQPTAATERRPPSGLKPPSDRGVTAAQRTLVGRVRNFDTRLLSANARCSLADVSLGGRRQLTPIAIPGRRTDRLAGFASTATRRGQERCGSREGEAGRPLAGRRNQAAMMLVVYRLPALSQRQT